MMTPSDHDDKQHHDGRRRLRGIKRPRDVAKTTTTTTTRRKQQSPLGALEFAATLNGDDPRLILSVLQQFTRTVRRERRRALLPKQNQDDDDDEENKDESDRDDDASSDAEQSPLQEEHPTTTSSPQQKKFKEAWMQDTKSYNVPFVGTSIARGSTGTVRWGQWPTGLLEAYLHASPMAAELLSSPALVPPSGALHRRLVRSGGNSSKQTKALSRTIHVAWLQAVSQVVTAVIPRHVLRIDLYGIPQKQHSLPEGNINNSNNNNHTKLRSVLLQVGRLRELVALVKEQVAVQAKTAGTSSYFSPLVAPALTVLANVAASSVAGAREVCRTLEASAVGEGVWNAILKSSRQQEAPKARAGDDAVKMQSRDQDSFHSAARVACLRLACILLEHRDGAVTSWIASPGSRERKQPPGILFVVLRHGLMHPKNSRRQGDESDHHFQSDDDYWRVVSRLLHSLQGLLPEKCIHGGTAAAVRKKSYSVLSKRGLADLLAGNNALQNICNVAIYAPELPEEASYILDPVESLDDNASTKDWTPLRLAAVQARRFLFPLLADPERSPFLSRIRQSTADKLSLSYSQQLVRVLLSLLECGTLAIQTFVIQCISTTPSLLVPFLKSLSIPDSSSTFAYISRLGFLHRVLGSKGIPTETSMASYNAVSGSKQVNEMLSFIIPVHFKKHILSKGVQSHNALVVAETLKIIVVLLKRYKDLLDSAHFKNASQWTMDEEKLLSDGMHRRLPDLQTVLAIRSRFDPFNDGTMRKASLLVDEWVCRVIETYAMVFPEVLGVVSFDWARLFPSNVQLLCSVRPSYQMRLLQTLENIFQLSSEVRDVCRVYRNAFPLIVRIMLRTKVNAIYTKSRSVSLLILRHLIGQEDSMNTYSETSTWIDGLWENVVDEFCDLVGAMAKSSFQQKITLAKAWKETQLDCPLETQSISVSPLLTAALGALRTCSNELGILTCQVAARCIMHHTYPLPIAALVVHCVNSPLNAQMVSSSQKSNDNGHHPMTQSALALSAYANGLLTFWEADCVTRLENFRNMVDALFSSNSLPSKLARLVTDDNYQGYDIVRHLALSAEMRDDVSALQACFHVLTLVQANKSFENKLLYVIRSLLPLAAHLDTKLSNSTGSSEWLSHPLVTNRRLPLSELSFADLVLFSKPRHRDRPLEMYLQSRIAAVCHELQGERNGGTVKVKFVRPILHLSLLVRLGISSSLSPVANLLLKSSRQELGQSSREMSLCLALAHFWLEESSSIAVESLFLAWNDLVRGGDLKNQLIVQLLSKLELILGRVLNEKHGWQEQSELYSLMLQTSPESVVSLCLRSMMARSQHSAHQRRSKRSFLSTVLECDIVLFGTLLLENILNEGNESGKTLLRDGELDHCLNIIARNEEMRKTSAFATVLSSVVTRFVSRGEEALRSGKVGGRASADLDESARLLVDASELLKDKELQQVMGSLAPSLSSSADLEIETRAALDLAEALIHIPTKSCLQGDLASIVLVKLFEAYQQALKLHFGSRKTLSSHRDIFDNTAKKIVAVVQKAPSCNQQLLLQGLDRITRTLRLCLKYGIAPSESADENVSESCVRLVRVLMTLIAAPSSAFHVLASKCDMLEPGHVYVMVISHSGFASTVVDSIKEVQVDANVRSGNQPRDANQAKLEVVRLLLCCVCLSHGSVNLDRSVWKTLLSGYNAGMTETDVTIRRLLYVANASVSDQDESVPFMDELHCVAAFGRPAESEHDDGKEKKVNLRTSWDWLIDGLDMGRIRCTLSQFPLFQKLHPDRLSDIEIWHDNESPTKDSNGSFDEGGSIISSNSSSELDASSDNSNQRASSEGDYKWSGQGPDSRYCPAFLLPLILATFEHYAPAEGVEIKRSLAEMESFVRVARLLCDKGALSLTLACLCCTCPIMRHLAVGTLRFFLVALESSQARALTTWRERPQLAMIVNAVQRGLCIRRAAALQSRLKNEYAQQATTVPMLPALVAVFLARAALVISRPGDAMFGPLNRYFLKDESDVGAFKDTNRLPAFISLFCSSADASDQARKERIWALQLLSSGFVDEDSYRLVSSCHAPELLLSHISSLTTRPPGDDKNVELILVINTVCRLLRHGGQRAASHLIRRIGLLSWLRAQLVSFPLAELLPSLESRIAFVRLIFLAVKRTELVARVQGEEIMRMELQALFNPVFAMYQETENEFDFNGANDASNKSSESPLLTAICETICVIGKALPPSHQKLSSYGLVLEAAARFLSGLPEQLKHQVVLPLCTAPVSLSQGEGDGACQFCVAALSLVRDAGSEHVVVKILQRALLLFENQEEGFSMEAKNALVKALLASRQKSFESHAGRSAWFACLQIVMNEDRGSSDAFRIVSDILSAQENNRVPDLS